MADAGYDFVKLTTDITPEVYDAIVARGGAERDPGHRPRGPAGGRGAGARRRASTSSTSTTTWSRCWRTPRRSRESVSDLRRVQPENWESLDYVDDAKVERIAGATARAGVWTTPDPDDVQAAFGLGQPDEEIRARPDWALMPAQVRGLYLRRGRAYWAKPPTEAGGRARSRCATAW